MHGNNVRQTMKKFNHFRQTEIYTAKFHTRVYFNFSFSTKRMTQEKRDDSRFEIEVLS
jgi:hypothetical protein